MNEPRRHHYIPQFILRNFCANDGFLFAYSKQSERSSVYQVKPKNVFLRKDLYAFEGAGGELNVSLEKGYARLESSVAPIVERMVNAVREGDVPLMSREERGIWDAFFYHQLKRTPDYHNPIIARQNFDKILADGIAEWEAQKGKLSQEKLREFSDPIKRKKIRQQAKIIGLAKSNPEVSRLLAKMGIRILKIVDAKKSFVVGSNPVVRMGPPNAGYLGHPEYEMWLPIAHDIAVSPNGSETGVQTHFLNDHNAIRRLNAKLFAQSEMIAGRSKQLVKSLTRSGK
ncbi:DUF4238 domain-containing protein [Kordiimonas sp.]|uniref:DUF4238 domain-containing protein n=1 Tax=Kordiimonas sp. TaxID=1970157 RepID=UPI003B51B9C3